MDIISHGLYSGVAFGRNSRKDYWMAFLFGVLPDLFAFTVPFWVMILGGQGFDRPSAEPPHMYGTDSYVYQLYSISHSVVIFALVFGLVWLLKRRPYLPMLGWPLHILVDIPTHSTQFFPTPFLWPLADVRVNGIPWGNPEVFIPNVLLLVGLYSWWFYKRRKNHDIKN